MTVTTIHVVVVVVVVLVPNPPRKVLVLELERLPRRIAHVVQYQRTQVSRIVQFQKCLASLQPQFVLAHLVLPLITEFLETDVDVVGGTVQVQLVHVLEHPVAIGAVQYVLAERFLERHVLRTVSQQREEIRRSVSEPRLGPLPEKERGRGDSRHVHEERLGLLLQQVLRDGTGLAGFVLRVRRRSLPETGLPALFLLDVERSRVDLDGVLRNRSALFREAEEGHEHRGLADVGHSHRER
mmetsp:Transcript_22995/g.48056  ORF Transcript_22995/g.48056 Transcript_22995/m.48056 type:complete len:240 (+) Transcript_22995:1029-1748(+)